MSKQLAQPTLIIVTGRPASGKSTLAHTLASRVPCPLISRDAMKEGLVNTVTGISHNIDLNRHVYHTFFETVEFLLKQSITIVIEAAFQHKLWIEKINHFQQIATIRLIICSIDTELAVSRFIERGKSDPERVKFHDNWADSVSIDRLHQEYIPPQADVPTLTIDTSDGYQPSIEHMLEFIRNSERK